MAFVQFKYIWRPIHIMQGEDILSLWVGRHSQQLAHHFYHLQVPLSRARPNSFLTRRKTPPTTMPCGSSRTKIWRPNTPKWLSLTLKATTSHASEEWTTRRCLRRWASPRRSRCTSTSKWFPNKRKNPQKRTQLPTSTKTGRPPKPTTNSSTGTSTKRRPITSCGNNFSGQSQKSMRTE